MHPSFFRDGAEGEEGGGVELGGSLGGTGGGVGGGVGVEGIGEIATVKKKLPTSTILLVGIVIAAAGGLVTMRKFGLGPQFSFGDTKSEIDMSKAANTEAHRRVLRDLTTSAIVAQVPVEQVQRNPFAMDEAFDGLMAKPEARNPGLDAAERARLDAERRAREEAERREGQIRQAAARLRLNSVIAGARPIARISDRNYQLGEKVGEFFTLVEIQQRSVTLETVGGEKFVIEMGK